MRRQQKVLPGTAPVCRLEVLEKHDPSLPSNRPMVSKLHMLWTLMLWLLRLLLLLLLPPLLITIIRLSTRTIIAVLCDVCSSLLYELAAYAPCPRVQQTQCMRKILQLSETPV